MGIISSAKSLFSNTGKFAEYINNLKSNISSSKISFLNSHYDDNGNKISYAVAEISEEKENKVIENIKDIPFSSILNKMNIKKESDIEKGTNSAVDGLMKVTTQIQEQEAEFQKIQQGSQQKDGSAQRANSQEQENIKDEKIIDMGSSSSSSSDSSTSSTSSSAGNQNTVKPQNVSQQMEQIQAEQAETEEQENEVQEAEEEKDRDDEEER